MARASDVSMPEGTWATNTPILTRIGTTILDMLNFVIVMVIAFFLTAFFGGVLEGAGVIPDDSNPFEDDQVAPLMGLGILLLGMCLWLFQTVVYSARSITPSPGKRRSNVVIVGEPYIAYNTLVVPRIPRLVARECLRAVSFLSVIGIFVPIFHRNNRALHDMLSGTRSMKIMATARDGVELVHERRLPNDLRTAVAQGKPLPDPPGAETGTGNGNGDGGTGSSSGSCKDSTGPPVQEPMTDPFNALNNLTGLDSVKTEVEELAATAQTDRDRAKHGFSVPSTTNHMVFTGNPGTGKTTVARIVGGIFKETGILKHGQVVEADSTQLIGQYVGQTAPQTKACIDAAVDGILFVDEAYRLTETRAAEQYGREAISTILTEMENRRDRLIVIVAGYPANMEQFLNANPGLKSRFARYIHFPDYDPEALQQIFLRMAEDNDFALDDDARRAAYERLSAIYTERDENFGNARTVRNLFDAVRRQQALRVQFRDRKTKGKLDKADLKNIMAEDIRQARVTG